MDEGREPVSRRVEAHYEIGGLLSSILEALAAMGKPLGSLTVTDLAPFDAFHIRGREATMELAQLAIDRPGLRVLDMGCGIGGSARVLASQFGAEVEGIDLTAEFIDVARELSRLVGLGGQTLFQCANVLRAPFENASFDVVWTEHVQMNVDDKRRMLAEAYRVLEPGGALALHDVFAGPNGEPHFPVPWADEASKSFLVQPKQIQSLAESLGFEWTMWEDVTEASIAPLNRAVELASRSSSLLIGPQLLMGSSYGTKLANILKSVDERRVSVAMGIATKVRSR